ncbi:hypothetical protein A1Q2_08041 [Trichosporon asahii var. asahii CBS 8904]|uniref:Uncharacterized protein n=2 Tax=Trichosporon asahii var. asahii TaxID=189963 RepID=K1VAB9_TRIAC|nr:hypothetical protein A1Q1_02009 [Trichosporon asahii var. asahii CBS 2479]EJT48914.1 hypothetical protein A1Q1_02009 [Trichosporon asahii var. asahii CBS 2479]EKC97660.1 hypothetical protein A1Q2_08041 [Trichosporon asahii var. asahii CBS 8904]
MLIPRPVPSKLLPTVQIIGRSDKTFTPKTHFLDSNPFSSLGVNRREFEARSGLSLVQVAIWSAHASWLARKAVGLNVDWDLWEFGHIAPPPDELLGAHLLPASSYADSVPPERPQAPTPARGTASGSDSEPTSYNWFLGEQGRPRELDLLDSPTSTYSDFSDASNEYLQDLVMTPPQPKRREPVSLADIRAFGSWQLDGVPSFGSDLNSPTKLRERMRRRSENVLGRPLAEDPSPSPRRNCKRGTYSGLGLGFAEKVSFRTAHSSIVQLGTTVKACNTSSWSESASSSSIGETPTRSGGVALPLTGVSQRTQPKCLTK